MPYYHIPLFIMKTSIKIQQPFKFDPFKYFLRLNLMRLFFKYKWRQQPLDDVTRLAPTAVTTLPRQSTAVMKNTRMTFSSDDVSRLPHSTDNVILLAQSTREVTQLVITYCLLRQQLQGNCHTVNRTKPMEPHKQTANQCADLTMASFRQYR